MARFLAGFCFASLLWGGLLYAHTEGMITISALSPSEPEVLAATEEQAAEAPAKGKQRKRKWRKKRRRDLTGTATSGDRLGGPGVRDLNAAESGGEEQLRGGEVEAGFDSVFPQVRRCLMLVDSDSPVRGKLVFGMRINGTGGVTKVNLKGPAAVTRTEAGACMRKAVKGIQFRSFDGPDMLVHYPLTLD